MGEDAVLTEYASLISSIPGAKLIEHGMEFPSLSEKASHMGFPPERIMKTLYFEDGEIVVAAVLPITERVDTRVLASETGAKKLRFAGENSLPRGQFPGSLGPWFPEEDGSRIARVVFNEGEYGISDWAYPGEPTVSIHADYSLVFRALSESKPGKYAIARIAGGAP